MSEPIIVQPGTPAGQPLNIEQYKEAFQYLHDEWMEADSLLDKLGVPAQIQIEDETETRSIADRIRLALDIKIDQRSDV